MKKIYVEMVADLFHYGHVEFLRRARALGDHLTVGVLSDEWTRQYKKLPVIPWHDRARVVEACRHVDAVLLQPEPATAQWLQENDLFHAIALKDEADRIRHRETSIGHDPAHEIELPYEDGVSTSAIIQRIESRAQAHQQKLARIRGFFAPRWDAGEWLLAEQMLKDVGHMLSANHIPYFLAFGSHLGAVRHGGVIPWDDDIDIAIREQDEARLPHLESLINQAGYNIVRYTTTSDTGTEIYYKLWMRNRPSTTDRAHSWPFIDIFVLRSSATDPAQCGLDHRLFPVSDIFPLKESAFGSLTLPVPNNPDLLALLYDADYMTRCFSTSYIHRIEKLAPKTIFCPAATLIEAGCFAPIHEMAGKIRATIPERVAGWSLDPASQKLIKGRVALQLDPVTETIWNSLDSKRSVDNLFRIFKGPPIDSIQTVLDGLNILQKQNAIRLEGAKDAPI